MGYIMYRYRRYRALHRKITNPGKYLAASLCCVLKHTSLKCVLCGSCNVRCEYSDTKHVHKCLNCVHEFRLRDKVKT